MPVSATTLSRRRMSSQEFRAFQLGRPDHERWELIGGLPVMMVPPTIAHNWIAGNLTRLLNSALAARDPARIAVERAGVELGNPDDEYRPEPDVLVIDADFTLSQRFVERAYLTAEIVSSTDYEPVAGSREPWIAVKRRLYLAHPPCLAVLVVEQNRVEVRIDSRGPAGWSASKLTSLDAELALPDFGLRCSVADLYDGTPLCRRLVRPAAT
jgi:Uma2 family endonuclease